MEIDLFKLFFFNKLAKVGRKIGRVLSKFTSLLGIILDFVLANIGELIK